MTVTVTKVKPGKSDILVAGSITEDWLQEVIKKSAEGYKIVSGSVIAYSLVKNVTMTKELPDEAEVATSEAEVATSEAEITTEEPEQVVEEVAEEAPAETAPVLDDELIASFEGNKDKLEDYGKQFGIDLRKNKSFKNMLKDLRNHVGG